MTEPPITRASLLLRIRNPADAEAWNQFVDIYTPLVYRYCLKRGVQHADACDVAQDVMQSVAQSIDRFEYDRQRGHFRSWLFTVARNQLCDHVKSQRKADQGSGRTTVHELMAEHPDQGESDEWDQECRKRTFEWAAEQARGQFQETTWQAFRMTAVDGRSTEEAAHATGLSVGAVYIAKSRVLARLRQLVSMLSDNGIEGNELVAKEKEPRTAG